MKKLIVVVGPTAVGKSALAISIARQFNGEVISADSRQIYTGLDIGTGKINRREMHGIPHHLLDIVSPKTIGGKKQFSAEQFRELAQEAIAHIQAQGRVPILCGGSGFYIHAAVDEVQYPAVAPNPTLRKKLAKKSVTDLFALLQKKDPRRAATIDRHNPHRLIRALEIVEALGKVPAISYAETSASPDILFIGLTLPSEKLREKISTRLKARLKQGMIREAQSLHRAGLSYKKMLALGLEYRSLARFLQKKITRQELVNELENAIGHYARRQMQWFKRDKRIGWYQADSKKDRRVLFATIKKFLSKKSTV